MCYLRILTSGYLQGNSQFFQEFVEGGRSMKEYCSQVTAHLSHNVYMFRQTVTHDCASILDSIAKKTSCSYNFSHGASLHPHSFIFACVL